MPRMTSLSRRIVGLVVACGIAGWGCGVHAEDAPSRSKPCEYKASVLKLVTELRDAGVSQSAVQNVVASDQQDDTLIRLKLLQYVADLYKNPAVKPDAIYQATIQTCKVR